MMMSFATTSVDTTPPPAPPPHTSLTIEDTSTEVLFGHSTTPAVLSELTVWDDHVEHTLKKWKCQAFVYMHLQAESAHHYRRMYDVLTFPVIVLNILASASIFTTTQQAIKYAVVIMTTIGAILTGLARQKRPAELAETHTLAAGLYSNVLSDVDSVLTMRPEMRPKVSLFIEKIKGELSTAKKQAPEPPRHILREFEEVYGGMEGMLYGDEIMQILTSGLRTKRALKSFYKSTNNVWDKPKRPTVLHVPNRGGGRANSRSTPGRTPLSASPSTSSTAATTSSDPSLPLPRAASSHHTRVQQTVRRSSAVPVVPVRPVLPVRPVMPVRPDMPDMPDMPDVPDIRGPTSVNHSWSVMQGRPARVLSQTTASGQVGQKPMRHSSTSVLADAAADPLASKWPWAAPMPASPRATRSLPPSGGLHSEKPGPDLEPPQTLMSDITLNPLQYMLLMRGDSPVQDLLDDATVAHQDSLTFPGGTACPPGPSALRVHDAVHPRGWQ